MSDPAHREPTPRSALVGSWLKLWNGDDSVADHLIGPDFGLHAAMLDGGDGSPSTGSTRHPAPAHPAARHGRLRPLDTPQRPALTDHPPLLTAQEDP